MRIFIHGVDTYLGRTLVRELRPSAEGNHRIFGTVVDAKSGRAPAVVKRVVSREDTKRAGKMATTIQSCRIVILDLFSCSLDDVYFVLNALGVDGRSDPPRQTKKLEKDVILIVVSSLMVWADTPQPGTSRPASPEAVAEPAEDPESADGGDPDEAADGEVAEAEGGPVDGAAESEGEAAEAAEAATGEGGEGEDPGGGTGDGEGSQAARSKTPTPVPTPTPPPPPIIRTPLKDSDYPRRKAVNGSRYAVWKDMEELVMSCFNREESQVKAFICAGGVLYGEGEELLAQLFKDAWLGEPTQAVTPPGTNTVPTVHVRDLARLVRHVGFSSNADPEKWDPIAHPFYVAVDPKPITQRELLQGVANEVCGTVTVPTAELPSRGCSPSPDGVAATRPTTGELPQEDARGDEDGQPPDIREALSLDLWVQPSDVMLQEAEEDSGAGGYVPDLAQPGWWCKEGFADGLRRAAEEFCWERSLRGMRVLISGPPGSGRTSLAQAVAEHFRLPHLELFPGEAAGGAGGAEDDVAVVPATPMVASYQDPAGPKAPHLDFESPVCRYRGYVLDAGPAGFSDMDQLFRYDDPVVAEGDGGDGEDGGADADGGDGEEVAAEPKPPKRLLNDDLVPTFVIVLQASEPVCRARWSLSRGHPLEKQSSSGAEGREAFEEAYEQYRATNMPDDIAQTTLVDFFQTEVGSGVLNMPVVGRDTEELFESVRIYMERDAMRWRYEPFDGKQMAIRSTPSLEEDQKTEVFLKPGSVFGVDKTKVVKYGEPPQNMSWLHLTDGRGWVFEQVPGQNVMCVKVEAGRPFNYLKTGEEIAAELLALRGRRQEEEAQLAEEQEQEHAGNDAELQEHRLQRECERMRIIAEHELARQEIEGLPLREYLLKYMIPSLTEGLIEVCKVLPEDPVDYLAAYLERHAAEEAAKNPH